MNNWAQKLSGSQHIVFLAKPKQQKNKEINYKISDKLKK